MKDIKKSWTTSDDEQTLEPMIKYFLACLSSDPLCIMECDDQFSEDPHDLIARENQGDKYYIKYWFQANIRL
jgi:hypothetical protein